MRGLRVISPMNASLQWIKRLHLVTPSQSEAKVSRSLDQELQKKPLRKTNLPVSSATVLFQNEKIVCLNKPAGVHSYSGKARTGDRLASQSLALEDTLHQMAKDLNCDSLRICHSPHPLYSGVTILAKSDVAANAVRLAFKRAKLRGEYIRTDLALTIGVPSPRSGLINVPIEKKEINGTIHALPVLNPSKSKMKQRDVKSRRTRYNVLVDAQGLALVELQPRDGLGQLSVLHVTCKMCQVLGDKEFSNRIVKIGGVSMFLDPAEVETGKQKLRFKVKRSLGSKTDQDIQNLPLHAHRWKLALPKSPDLGLYDDTVITAPIPVHMSKTLQQLGIKPPVYVYGNVDSKE